jgi:hypothetical protein
LNFEPTFFCCFFPTTCFQNIIVSVHVSKGRSFRKDIEYFLKIFCYNINPT